MTNCSTQFKDYHCENIHTWCTNCGNYGIFGAVKRALSAQCIEPKNTVMCFDIGCHGNGSDKIKGYNIHGLHGRVIPLGTGASVANQNLTVISFGGDGGTLSEGINHLIHAIRNDFNMVFIMNNNHNYGLTTGQASATTPEGYSMNASPDGVTTDVMNTMDIVLALNPSFAARGFSGNVNHLTKVIQAGLIHKGFSFIEVMQSCPSYNKATPHEWYMERVFDVNMDGNYDTSNLEQAKKVASDLEEKIAIGVLYQDDSRKDFLARQLNRQDVTTELVEEVDNYPIENLLNEFK